MTRKAKKPRNPVEVIKSYGKELDYKNKYSIENHTAIRCLGLGNLELRAPKYQLAFLLQICCSGRVIDAYDPIWKDYDFDLLQNYTNINIISSASYKVAEKTLFVMFHCPHELLEQVVEQNIDSLDLIVLLCNDIADYKTTKYLNLSRVANLDNLVQTPFELEQFHSSVFTGTFWHSWKSVDECINDIVDLVQNINI
jgi:SRR1